MPKNPFISVFFSSPNTETNLLKILCWFWLYFISSNKCCIYTNANILYLFPQKDKGLVYKLSYKINVEFLFSYYEILLQYNKSKFKVKENFQNPSCELFSCYLYTLDILGYRSNKITKQIPKVFAFMLL